MSTDCYAAIPLELRNQATWLLHKITFDPKKGEESRIPHGADGKPTNTNPDKFLTFENACKALPRFDGLTFALTGGNVFCVDLDDCRNHETGELTPAAREIVDSFGDTYIEVSGSGKGLHIWGRGKLPKNSHPDKSWVELYDHIKPIAMTGNPERWDRSDLLDCQDALTALFRRCESGEFKRTGAPRTSARTTGDLSAGDFRLALCLARENRCDEAKTLKAFLQQSRNDPKKLARRDYAPNTVRKAIAIVRPMIDSSRPAQTITLAEEPETAPSDGDMPAECLDGWLGQVCRERMADFPRGFAWPALLGAASVYVPQASDVHCNLDVDLDGPIHGGKSTTWNKVFHLLSLKKNTLPRLDAKCGSVEGMVQLLQEKGVNGQSVIVFPDELAHLLQKAAIEHAAFPQVLCDAFYTDQQELTVANRKHLTLNARITLLGGTVAERFGDLFGAATTQGLYDRFLFGSCPEDYRLPWVPFDHEPPAFTPTSAEMVPSMLDERPVVVKVERAVFDEINRWKKEYDMGRVAEIALRCAVIAASFDRRPKLTVDNLGPAFELAKYQMRLRKILQPNPGENPDAQMAFKIMTWLQDNAADGRWTGKRLLTRMISAHRLGPGVFDRAVTSLVKNGELEIDDFALPGNSRKSPCVRLAVRNPSAKVCCYSLTDSEVGNAR